MSGQFRTLAMFLSWSIQEMCCKYPSDDVAMVLEEVNGGGEFKCIGKAGEAESKDKEVQEPEKTLFPWSRHVLAIKKSKVIIHHIRTKTKDIGIDKEMDKDKDKNTGRSGWAQTKRGLRTGENTSNPGQNIQKSKVIIYHIRTKTKDMGKDKEMDKDKDKNTGRSGWVQRQRGLRTRENTANPGQDKYLTF